MIYLELPSRPVSGLGKEIKFPHAHSWLHPPKSMLLTAESPSSAWSLRGQVVHKGSDDRCWVAPCVSIEATILDLYR